jgi:hypothetical protein
MERGFLLPGAGFPIENVNYVNEKIYTKFIVLKPQSSPFFLYL